MAIHQVLAGSARGDAITNEALTLRATFRERGPSEVFVPGGNPDLGVLPLRDYAARFEQPGDILVLHPSTDNPEFRQFIEASSSRRLVVRYHNITPAEHFRDYSPELAELLVRTREGVVRAAELSRLVIADSRYNADDLAAMGCTTPSRVVPIVTDFRRLSRLTPSVVPNFPMPDSDQPLILFVSRIAPNKGHPDLLKAFHVLTTYMQRDAHLLLIGTGITPRYQASLTAFVEELGLRNVTFTGGVSDADLACAYRRADVFVCLSSHEGFGVPLLESMGFGLPVIARDAAAVADTIGAGGLVVESAAPTLVAEAVNLVLTSGEMRRHLISAGRRRVADFDVGETSRRFLEALDAA